MLAFGGFSPIHWIVIGIVALLLFGNRLPEVARSIGRAINEFKKGMREVDKDLDEPDSLPPPKSKDNLKPPTSAASQPPRDPASAEREEEDVEQPR